MAAGTTREPAWPEAAFLLFEQTALGTFSVDVDVAHSGRDLPDVNLDALCEMIFAGLNSAPPHEGLAGHDRTRRHLPRPKPRDTVRVDAGVPTSFKGLPG